MWSERVERGPSAAQIDGSGGRIEEGGAQVVGPGRACTERATAGSGWSVGSRTVGAKFGECFVVASSYPRPRFTGDPFHPATEDTFLQAAFPRSGAMSVGKLG